ncbi:hypothetical protein CSC74_08085 [Pseudoxanthomonas yeongjuensis]|nr:hypothetical protein CSC74_08085 [Pseudoxanthomonas yeongjuensis]
MTEVLVSDKNNAAFLLLHNGLINEADEILSESVKSGRYDAYTLSNLALCKALKKEHDKAQAFMKAAKHKKRSGHAAAVIAFNDCIMSFLADKRPDAISSIRAAMRLSPKEIKKYCELSVHLDGCRSDADFVAILSGS